jgi:hypothetical protein
MIYTLFSRVGAIHKIIYGSPKFMNPIESDKINSGDDVDDSDMTNKEYDQAAFKNWLNV